MSARRPRASDAQSPALSRAIMTGQPFGAITRTDVLNNITLYWLTNTVGYAARLYWENQASFYSIKNVAIPAAVSVFPGERYQAPRSWAERAYANLVYFNEVDRGGPSPPGNSSSSSAKSSAPRSGRSAR